MTPGARCPECGGRLECVNPDCGNELTWWVLYRHTPCATCGHPGGLHDSEDANCETHRTDGGIGVCPCNQYVPSTLAPIRVEGS